MEFLKMLYGYIDDIVFVDTETTGLGGRDEVCQVAVIDFNEKELFNHLIRPCKPIPSEATKVHGITDAMVADKESIYYWWRFLSGPRVLGSKIIVGYNVFFDVRMLNQSIALRDEHGKNLNLQPLMVIDLMLIVSGNKGWLKLSTACEKFGEATDDDRLHDALYDCIMTSRVFKKIMSGEYRL